LTTGALYLARDNVWFLHFDALHLPYSLDGNSIADSGAGMLADALKVNQSLQNLRSAIYGICHACQGYMPL